MTLRFTYTSLVTPDSVIDYDMRAGSWQLKKQDEIASGYDPARYQSERVFATALAHQAAMMSQRKSRRNTRF